MAENTSPDGWREVVREKDAEILALKKERTQFKRKIALLTTITEEPKK